MRHVDESSRILDVDHGMDGMYKLELSRLTSRVPSLTTFDVAVSPFAQGSYFNSFDLFHASCDMK
jgi:hypothetical protein